VGEPLIHKELTDSIISAAIKVHKALGAGLLESAYETCMVREFELRSIPFQRQVNVPLLYEGMKLDCGYRLDLLVADTVIVEIKSIEKLQPIHEAQLLTYLKLMHKPVGLLLNFNSPLLRDGLVRLVL
jgi:GxxExxY protein